jgi:hypothetical protein
MWLKKMKNLKLILNSLKKLKKLMGLKPFPTVLKDKKTTKFVSLLVTIFVVTFLQRFQWFRYQRQIRFLSLILTFASFFFRDILVHVADFEAKRAVNG